jgi:hypothetical protein
VKEERPKMLEALEMLSRLPLPGGKSKCVVCGHVADIDELRSASTPDVGHTAGCRLIQVLAPTPPRAGH